MFSGQHGIISALISNVREFKRAVDTATELKECKTLMTGMQDQIDGLRRDINRLTAPPTIAEKSEVS